MMDIKLLYLAGVFVAVAGVTMLVAWQTRGKPLVARLRRLTAPTPGTEPHAGWVQKLKEVTGPLAKLSLPAGNWEESRLRVRFMNAGYRSGNAPVVFFAAKTALTFALPGAALVAASLYPMAMPPQLFLGGLVVLAAAGYVFPNVLLAHRIALRKREVFEHFPDAIDLMTVCVEAGLGLDAALARVGTEMTLGSPTLAEELHLVNLELRAGASRETALRNLALRTGVEEVDLLVSLLVQSDRFGTSVATALRVHSDSLRVKRRQRAEEMAAKIPVKLLFPVIFCIFPSMLMVLLGPAFVSVYRLLLPNMTGGPPMP
jgi:tight adherence protein C